jgi:hypothetical protein
MNAAPALQEPDRSRVINVALNEVELLALDHWIARRREPRPTREEAVRRLVKCGLSGHPGQ